MIKNFKYFRYGYPVDMPAPIYALYQPVLNRFLTITGNLEISKKLVGLLTIRYSTYVCLINTAKNFTPNIIDNEVCDSWTLDNISEFAITDGLADHPIINANRLVESTKHDLLWDIEKEKKWILFCTHWLEFFAQVRSLRFTFSEIDNTMCQILNDLPGPYYPEYENKVLKMLFFGTDVDQVESQIQNYLQTTAFAPWLAKYNTEVENFRQLLK